MSTNESKEQLRLARLGDALLKLYFSDAEVMNDDNSLIAYPASFYHSNFYLAHVAELHFDFNSDDDTHTRATAYEAMLGKIYEDRGDWLNAIKTTLIPSDKFQAEVARKSLVLNKKLINALNKKHTNVNRHKTSEKQT